MVPHTRAPYSAIVLYTRRLMALPARLYTDSDTLTAKANFSNTTLPITPSRRNTNTLTEMYTVNYTFNIFYI